MPRVTKAHMKESIVTFATDVLEIMNDYFNLNDFSNNEGYYDIERNGWYYHLHKSVVHFKPEIHIYRHNYRQGNTIFKKDQPKGHRIYEDAWIYREGACCTTIGRDENGNPILSKDNGFLMGGYSFQGYVKKMF